MIKETILNYISEQVKNLSDFSKKSAQIQNEDNLHQLRVACKKLKALYQVLSSITEGDFDSRIHFVEVGKLFKAVGRLRDLHVQLELLETVAAENSILLPEEFVNQFKDNIQKIEISVKEAIEDFNEELMKESLETASALTEKIEDDIILKNIKKLIKKRLKQVKTLLPEKKDEEKIHLMRKRVKQICYIVDLLKVVAPNKNYFRHYERFKTAAELLGKWHDYTVLMSPVLDSIDLSSDDETMLDVYACLKFDERIFLKKARKKLTKYFN